LVFFQEILIRELSSEEKHTKKLGNTDPWTFIRGKTHKEIGRFPDTFQQCTPC
jgi:hypothetical protein